MNVIIYGLYGVCGGIIGNYIAPSIKTKASNIYAMFQYPSKIIDTKVNPIEGNAIFKFLIAIIDEKQIFTNTANAMVNLTGFGVNTIVPTEKFEYKEYYYGTLISFGIYITDGTGQHNFVYQIYGRDFEEKLNGIIQNFTVKFYKQINNITLIPLFSYENYWYFNPKIITNTRPDHINIVKQREIVENVHGSQYSGILIYGNQDSGKMYTAFLIGLRLKHNIYCINNLLDRDKFIDSIRDIPPNSICLIRNIDEIFSLGLFTNKVNIDTIRGIFDIVAQNVLIIFLTNNKQAYGNITQLFRWDRIAQEYRL